MQGYEGILRVVKGDVTNPQRAKDNEIVIIPHCCNNKKIWGGGFVIALSKKWKEPEKIYRDFFNQQYPTLGHVCYAEVNKRLIVANMIGQDGIMADTNPKPIKYRDLANAMYNVFEYVEMVKSRTSDPVAIHAPKFGSLRAGGNWNFLLDLIAEIWIQNGIDVTIYEFEE